MDGPDTKQVEFTVNKIDDSEKQSEKFMGERLFNRNLHTANRI